MQCALIDIGSNSMRLSVYEVHDGSFRILFHDKVMAGLAGYVEKRHLTSDGIARACEGLLQFRSTLELLGIDDISVFATASLRNIENSPEATAEITRQTGFPIEIISGRDEALYGYAGAMFELGLSDGVFIDIGGGSTEIVSFDNGEIATAESLSIGSLRLYADYVKKIIPNSIALGQIEERVRRELSSASADRAYACVAGVGGTARAALKLVKRLYGLSPDCREMSAAQLNELWYTLTKTDRTAISLILKTEPERIHTIIPGIAILREIVGKFGAQKIVISNYGVREGYLCHRVLKEI